MTFTYPTTMTAEKAWAEACRLRGSGTFLDRGPSRDELHASRALLEAPPQNAPGLPPAIWRAGPADAGSEERLHQNRYERLLAQAKARDWCWSLNEEEYEGTEDSRESAIAAAREALDSDGESAGTKFWVGRADQLTAKEVVSVCVDSVLDSIGDRAYEMIGEAAESWPTSPSAEARAELEAALNKVTEEWLDKHDAPCFWRVVETEELTS